MFYETYDYIRNQYYDELKEYTPYIRQAMLFRYMLQDMPLTVKDTDYIAGWYGYQDAEAPKVSEKKHFPYNHLMDEKQVKMRKMLAAQLRTDINFTPAHTCIDYGLIVEKGLEHYLTLVNGELQKEPDNDCLRAMQISLHAAFAYAERFAAVAREKANHTKDPAQKVRFENMYTALCRIPRFGARNFLEAVQSVWIMHSLVPMAEMSWASISLGRMDQYLLPFYQKYIAEGGKVEEAKAILKNLFVLLDTYGDGACAMNLGGMDADNNHMINDLSRLLIQVEKEMLLRAPIVAVRVTPDMPEDVLDDLIDFELFKIGQPTFYGELPCRQAVAGRGIKESDAVGFSVNSCMGLIVPGREFADMWGIKFNAHLPLELAINKGRPINGDTSLDFATMPKEITNFEQLLAQYGCYFSELMAVCADTCEAVAWEQEANTPDPFLSALTDGCIQNRRDRATGAVYNTVTVETLGLINTCDALAAIKELVFEQKKYTLEALITAARNNYAGCDAILADLSKCKKYGMNDAGVNAICKRVCEMAASACKKVCRNNRYFLPSLHTIDANVGYGQGLYATLDGRKAGQPVNKNANPSNLLTKIEHTSHILSATAFDQRAFSGGQPIDLYFEKAWFETKETKEKIKNLILTYLELGGLQLQVNSIDIALLEKAHEQPKEYPYVIVRKGGYSVRFNEMGEKERADFIEQAKRMERNGA